MIAGFTVPQARGIRPSPSQSGIALIMVLWILSLLAVLALELSYAARTELKIASNTKEETQNYYIARAGIERGIAQILAQSNEQPGLEKWNFGGGKTELSFGKGIMEIAVTDESGKINVNTMDDATLTAVLRQVLSSIGVEERAQETAIDSILDWRDPDNLHRANGAEDNYYRSLLNPYSAKNGRLDSLDELVMVKGVTPEIFFGKPSPDAAGTDTPPFGLKDVLTIYPRIGRNRKPNINAAPLAVLVALGSTEEEARNVIDYRLHTPIEGRDQLKEVLGTNALPPWTIQFSFVSATTEKAFTVEASGHSDGSELRRRVRALVTVRNEQPFAFRVARWTDRPRGE